MNSPRGFSIEVEERDGVTVLHAHGRITIGSGDIALRNAFHLAIEGGSKKIVIDMRDVRGADSSGIGELVSLVTTAANRKVILVFAELREGVKNIFIVTQLISVLTYADSLELAVNAIKGISFAEFVAKLAYKKIDSLAARRENHSLTSG